MLLPDQISASNKGTSSARNSWGKEEEDTAGRWINEWMDGEAGVPRAGSTSAPAVAGPPIALIRCRWLSWAEDVRLIHIFVDSVFATPEDDDSERHLARVLSAIQTNTMKETLHIIQHRISCTAQPYPQTRSTSRLFAKWFLLQTVPVHRNTRRRRWRSEEDYNDG